MVVHRIVGLNGRSAWTRSADRGRALRPPGNEIAERSLELRNERPGRCVQRRFWSESRDGGSRMQREAKVPQRALAMRARRGRPVRMARRVVRRRLRLAALVNVLERVGQRVERIRRFRLPRLDDAPDVRGVFALVLLAVEDRSDDEPGHRDGGKEQRPICPTGGSHAPGRPSTSRPRCGTRRGARRSK